MSQKHPLPLDPTHTHLHTDPTRPDPLLPLLPARPIQDGHSGQMAWLPLNPPTTTNPSTQPSPAPSPSFFFQHVAATTTPFGPPQRPAALLLRERGLDPAGLVDALVG